jgi:hypothetical protein
VRVGGIRISHLSDIPADTSLSLTETKGRKAVHVVRRLEMPARDDHLAALRIAAGVGTAALVAAWGQVPAAVRRSLGSCPQDLKDAAAQADREHAAAETPRDSTAPVLDALNAAAGVRDA